MSHTTIVSTDELAAHLTDPEWVVLDARFTLDDETWGTRAYSEGHIPGAVRSGSRRRTSQDPSSRA